jgi:hypothetical protein
MISSYFNKLAGAAVLSLFATQYARGVEPRLPSRTAIVAKNPNPEFRNPDYPVRSPDKLRSVRIATPGPLRASCSCQAFRRLFRIARIQSPGSGR